MGDGPVILQADDPAATAHGRLDTTALGQVSCGRIKNDETAGHLALRVACQYTRRVQCIQVI
jgi:hypothetical protein